MNRSVGERNFVSVCVIVNHGQGSRVLRLAKQCGVSGGTIFFGRGTVKNRILELLELYDVRKEIVLFVTDTETEERAIAEISSRLHLNKPNHGIAYSIGDVGFLGCQRQKIYDIAEESGGETKPMYHAIFTIAEKGKAEQVVEAAEKAGSRGGTVINARGAGIHETNTLFSMAVEPEKEMVVILSKSDKTDAIVDAIYASLKLDEPGNGIMFVQDVKRAYGLFEA